MPLANAWRSARLHLRIAAPVVMSVAATSRRTGMQPSIFHSAKHPIIEADDPPGRWGWCYLNEVLFDLSDRSTPRLAGIPRYY
jgi:hypothetical protein